MSWAPLILLEVVGWAAAIAAAYRLATGTTGVVECVTLWAVSYGLAQLGGYLRLVHDELRRANGRGPAD